MFFRDKQKRKKEKELKITIGNKKGNITSNNTEKGKGSKETALNRHGLKCWITSKKWRYF